MERDSKNRKVIDMQKNIGGIMRECYPLTPAQLVHIYTLNYSPTQ